MDLGSLLARLNITKLRVTGETVRSVYRAHPAYRPLLRNAPGDCPMWRLNALLNADSVV
jgi:hypothetical protein